MKTAVSVLLGIVVFIVRWIITLLVLFFLWSYPAIIPGKYFEQPSFLEYGNSSANLHNGGRVCEYEDDVLIRTSEGIMLFSTDDYELTKLIDQSGNYINVVDGKVYFDAALKGIHQYDIKKDKLSLMPGSWLHSSYTFQVVGDKAFTYMNVTFSSISQVNIDKRTRHYIRGREAPRNCEYHDGYVYYVNEGYKDYENDWVCKLTDEGENIGLFDSYRSVNYFIYEDSIYYALYNAEKYPEKMGLWRYDLATDTNEKLMEDEDNIFLYNIIDGKLLYKYAWDDNSHVWYSFDIESKEIVRHSEENRRVVGIYTANDLIFVYLKNQDDYFFRVYDKDGNYIGVEIDED